MSSNTNLGNTPVNQGFVQLIHTGETGGIDGTLRTLFDGDGTASDLQIASDKVKISTELFIGSKTLTEFVQDTVGAMFTTGNSLTNISITYDDANGNIDLSASGEVTLTGSQTLSNKTLASPTFTGDVTFNDASTPQLKIKDTTNNVLLDLRATDTLAAIGTTTDSPLHLKQNGQFQLSINSSQIILNASGEDRNTIIRDDSGTAVFKVNAGTSKTEISTLLLDSVTISTIQTGSESFADNDTSLMTSAAINDKIGTEVASLVDSAPDDLNTLNELAAALGDDENFATTVTNNIATKLAKASNLSDLANASTARSNLGVDEAGTDNSTNVTLAGSLDYITLSGQEITRNAINLTTDVSGALPIANGGTGATSDSAARTALGLGSLAELSSVSFSNISGSAVQTSAEIGSSFADNDTTLLTAAAVNDRIESFGYTTNTGDITGVSITASDPLDISQSNTLSGDYSATISLDASEFQGYLTDMTENNLGADELLIIDSNDTTLKRKAINEIKLTTFDSTGFSSGVSLTGNTSNGLLTFLGANAATVESELTYTAGTLKLERATGNAIFRIQSNDSNPRIYFNEGNTTRANLGYSISNNRFELFADGNTPFSIEDGAGSNTLVVDSNSRVGVGTASPSYLLHLSGTAPELAFTDTDGSATWRTRAVANNFHITETGAGDPFVIQSGAGGNAITIMSTGNVSIGGATASRDLQVNGDGIIRVLNDSGDSGIDFNASDMQIRYRSASDKLQFYSYGTSTNVATIQKSDGFLGLGTESPTSLLTTSGGDIRILGSGNRLRFNTNGSIYWDNSIGVKLENASTENITIETNTSGDIKFNTANTGTMVLTDDKEVFIGETTQNQNLAFGGTLKTHQYLDTRDYMQHKGHFAESDWIVMESGANHVVTSYFDNTNVYVDGVFKAKIDSAFGQATISSADLSLGSVISADRAVIVHQSGTIRSMCMNERFSGRLLGSGSTRGYPLTINIYAPYTSVSYSIYRSSSANVDLSATALTTGTISQGGIITFTESDTASGTQHYVIEADGKVCATLDDGGNDHLLFTPLSMEVIASSFSREIRGGVTTGVSEDSTSISETQNGTHAFYLKDTSGKHGLFACGVADGAGSEAEFAMPIEFCSDYYIYGSTDLSNYRLVCFQDTFVKVLDASGNVLYTHDGSNATKHAPLYFDNGTATGAGTLSTAGPFRFVGTAPFQLVCQEPGGQDEATMLGAMQHELSNNQRFKGGYVPNATTIDANLVVNDSNFTLFADSANNKVGIGTASPLSKIHIEESTNDADALMIRQTAGASGSVQGKVHIGMNHFNSTNPSVRITAEELDVADFRGNLAFSTRAGTSDVAPTEKMRITHDGSVGIGTTSPSAKLNIVDSGETIIKLFASTASTRSGIWFTNGSYSYGTNIGTDNKFHITGNINSEEELVTVDASGNMGIGTTSPQDKLHIEGTTSSTRMRVKTTTGSAEARLITNNGDWILSSSGSSNLFQIFNATTSATYFAIDSNGDVGIGGGTTSFKLDVQGGSARISSGGLGVGVNPSGTTGRGDFSNDVVAFSTSDERLKENIKPLDNALDKVLKISGVEFDWKELTEEEKKTIHGNQGHDVGVIAQEVEEVLPEVVTTRDTGYKAVKYEKIVPLLIQAIKEQQEQINKLEDKLNG